MDRSAPDVAVVGGGLVGLCTALALQRTGADTLLVDPGMTGAAASFGNAGHIAVEQVTPLANPAAVQSAAGRLFAFGGPLDFRLGDAPAWAGWARRYLSASRGERARAGTAVLEGLLGAALPAWRRLVEDVARPELLIESGHLGVWERDRTARAGRGHWSEAPTGEARLRDLSPEEFAALRRLVRRPVHDGVGFVGTAQVASPAEAMRAVGEAFERMGGRRLAARATRLLRDGDRVGLELQDSQVRPGLVVVAAGVGSRALMRGLGHAAPLVAERGYHIEAEAGGWDAWLPPVVFEDRAMIVTCFGDRLRAASFVEFARPDAPADPRKWRRLERHVADLGLPFTGERSRWVGSRPTLPDYLPAIGRSARARNLLYAFGHQHLGLTLAPLTGELVVQMATHRSPSIPLEPFDLARYDDGAGAKPPPA